jgi:GAF domain-containing protein
MMEAIKRFFAAPKFEDPNKTISASLLNFITIAYLLVSVFVSSLALLSSENIASTIGDELIFLSPLFIILIISQILMRQGRVHIASLFFAVTHWLSITFGMLLSGGIEAAGLFNYILSILIFGLLLGSRYAIFSAGASLGAAILALILGNQGLLPTPVIPISGITNLLTFVVLTLLGTALLYLYLQRLNDLRQQEMEARQKIEENQANLERRVSEATQALTLAAQVGQSISLLSDPDTMLPQAAELIREYFDLYHTQIYLVDATGRSLILRASTGETGQQLLRREHRLPVDLGSINGTAVVERQAVIVEDTETSVLHRPNPLLPETRSEMAIPLIAGERVVGVLDLQSSQPGGLTAKKLAAFDVLAGQLAVAIVNAELLAEIDQSRLEVERQARRLGRENWQEFLDAIHERERIAYVYAGDTVKPLDEPLSTNTDDVLTVPIDVSGEPVGMLQFEGQETWTTEEQTTAHIVARQAAQQIENLRLLAQAERYRAEAEDAIRRLTREGWETYLERNPLKDVGFVYQDFQVKPLSEVTSRPEERYTYPIKIGDVAIGDLCAANPEKLSSEEQELVALVSEQLSAHLENLRLSAETEQRVTELAVVNRISTMLTQSSDLVQMLTSVIEHLTQTFDVNSAYIALYDSEKQVITSPATLYHGEWITGRTATPLGQGINSYIILNQKTVFVNRDTDHKLRELGAIPITESEDDKPLTRSYIGVPMIIGDQVVGVLSINDPDQEGRFTEADVNLLSTIAANTAVAVQSARSFAEVQRRAQREQALRKITSAVTSSTDPVTIMRTAVQEVGSILGRRAIIRMSPPKSEGEDSVA